MDADQVIREAYTRVYPEVKAGEDTHLVMAFCGPKTQFAIRTVNESWLAQVIRAVVGIPEGKVYILTEGALRERLADWPAGDVLEIGGA